MSASNNELVDIIGPAIQVRIMSMLLWPEPVDAVAVL